MIRAGSVAQPRTSRIILLAPRVLRAAVLIALVGFAVFIVTGRPLFGALTVGGILFAIPLRSAPARVRVGTKPPRDRALIVGAGWAGTTIAELIRELGERAKMELVGFVDDDLLGMDRHGTSLVGDQLLARGERVEVIGPGSSLAKLIEQHEITTLILAVSEEFEGALLQVLIECLELGVRIVPMHVLYEELTGRVPVEHVGAHWSVAIPIDHPGTRKVWPLVKRAMDIVLASIGLAFLAVITPCVALAIRATSEGPVFYSQKRVGKGGRTFTVHKFRSMVEDAESDGPIWATEDDPRVTKVGRFLRRTHIDEFPQFINIVRGQMSVVGPRPERPEFVQMLAEEIPFYRVRNAVRPGMAGWGLVRQGYGSSTEDALEKLQYDLYYIKHQSIWLDLTILFKTIFDTVLFRGR